MSKISLYILLAVVMLSGCIKDSINIDPTRSSEENFDPNYLLTSAQLDYGNVTEFQLYELAPMVQVLSSTFDYYGGGDKYNIFLNSYNDRFFSDGLTAAAKLLEAQSLAEKKGAEANSNLIQISKIMWVITMQRITDIYGDIPYSQAGMAKAGIQTPKYDKQEDIYKDMLVRLESAVLALDPSKPLAAGDLFYGGNVESWKKLGYSLMLRVAMRLTKVDIATAKLYAEKCAGKTFADNSDNGMLKLDGGSNAATQNKTSNALLESLPQVRWSETFINYLKSKEDPRLYAITEKADTGLLYNNEVGRGGKSYSKTPSSTAVNEVPAGMPNGYDLNGARPVSSAPGYPGPTGTGANASPLGNYARPKMAVFASVRSLPIFIITYAQTELLLAEAKTRGWNMGISTAQEHYKNGVVAAIESLELLNGMLTIDIDYDAFISAHHMLDPSSPEKSIEMINSEYWVATLFDFPESYSNYRRSGYPSLKPVNYPGNITNGTIPRRLAYPLGENANNRTSYQDALLRLGGTDLTTKRVWWDKE